jgi:hypothetical protein
MGLFDLFALLAGFVLALGRARSHHVGTAHKRSSTCGATRFFYGSATSPKIFMFGAWYRGEDALPVSFLRSPHNLRFEVAGGRCAF